MPEVQLLPPKPIDLLLHPNSPLRNKTPEQLINGLKHIGDELSSYFIHGLSTIARTHTDPNKTAIALQKMHAQTQALLDNFEKTVQNMRAASQQNLAQTSVEHALKSPYSQLKDDVIAGTLAAECIFRNHLLTAATVAMQQLLTHHPVVAQKFAPDILATTAFALEKTPPQKALEMVTQMDQKKGDLPVNTQYAAILHTAGIYQAAVTSLAERLRNMLGPKIDEKTALTKAHEFFSKLCKEAHDTFAKYFDEAAKKLYNPRDTLSQMMEKAENLLKNDKNFKKFVANTQERLRDNSTNAQAFANNLCLQALFVAAGNHYLRHFMPQHNLQQGNTPNKRDSSLLQCTPFDLPTK